MNEKGKSLGRYLFGLFLVLSGHTCGQNISSKALNYFEQFPHEYRQTDFCDPVELVNTAVFLRKFLLDRQTILEREVELDCILILTRYHLIV